MKDVARFGVIALLLVGCSSVTDAGDAPVLDVSVDEEVIGSVDAGTWCRISSLGTDACIAADGPVSSFDVACGADVDFAPRGTGWLLSEANVPVQELQGLWSVGRVTGDILIDMDSARTEASWFFIIERSGC